MLSCLLELPGGNPGVLPTVVRIISRPPRKLKVP